MIGIRKRVTIGFLSIVGLLFFSGLVSLFELNRVSRGSGDILKANQRNIELAKEMLDAAHQQNLAYIRLSLYHELQYDTLCRAGMSRLEQTLQIARSEAIDERFLDPLAFAIADLRVLTDNFLTHNARRIAHESQVRERERLIDSLDRLVAQGRVDSLGFPLVDSATLSRAMAPAPTLADFAEHEHYDAAFLRLTSAIQDYMTSTQSSLAPHTEQLKKNAYRAVTPVLISLLVMIAIVLLLFYFMLLYCVNPILKINRSLSDWLQFRIPYRPKGDFQDELKEINEQIDTLVNLSKQVTNNR